MVIWWHIEWLIIRQRLAVAVWTGRILAQFSTHRRTWDTPSPYQSLRCSILFIYTITVTFIIGDPRIWCTGLNGTATESTKQTNSTEQTSPPSQRPAWSANKQTTSKSKSLNIVSIIITSNSEAMELNKTIKLPSYRAIANSDCTVHYHPKNPFHNLFPIQII